MIGARSAVAVFLMALGVCGACEGGGGEGGETHWLGDCETDADCGGGQCLCKVCTRTCSGDQDCPGSHAAACFDTTSPGLVKRCAGSAAKALPGICLGTCEMDGDCPSGDVCLLGACVAGARGSETHDAGIASPGQIASSFVHVDAGIGFGEPVEPPAPRPLIDGADALVGKWVEVESDGSPCRPELEGLKDHLGGGVACPTLEIGRDAEREGITGHIWWAYDPNATDVPAIVLGPYAPATDPSKGYPVEVPPEVYADLVRIAPEVRYRVLDGAFDGTTLSFWLSAMDLWTDWCSLQTPYPFELGGVKGYRCVPADASVQNTDLGKLALCVSALDAGVCLDRFGNAEPCCHRNDGGVPCGDYNACICTASRCVSDLRRSIVRFEFTLSGGALHGHLRANTGDLETPRDLVKVSL